MRPAIAVSLDDDHLVTVSCEDYDVLAVYVGGTRVEAAFATLDLSGGIYPDEGESTYLTWINQRPLESDQCVRVALLESGATSRQGKTIEELFPGEKPKERDDFVSMQQLLHELRSEPNVRAGYAFEYQAPTGEKRKSHTGSEEYGFGFHVLWNWLHPERAGVSLHTYSIDSLQDRTPGNDHVREQLQLGQSVSLRIDKLKE